MALLAGHNIASFDVPRLTAMFKRHERFLGAEIFRPLDTMQLAWWYAAGSNTVFENFSMTTLCEAFDIDTTGAHDALADARMCVQLSKTLHERARRA